jgi:hypothetical protein
MILLLLIATGALVAMSWVVALAVVAVYLVRGFGGRDRHRPAADPPPPRRA